MKLIKKWIVLLFCLLYPLYGTAFAATLSDTDNHINLDNADYKIPKIYQYLGPENGWVKPGKNLITNFYEAFQPEVVYVPQRDNEKDYPYLMYFSAWAYNASNDPQGDYPGYPGGDAIFLARAKEVEGPWEVYSKDLKTNEVYWDTRFQPKFWVPVIVCQDTWYDSWHVADSSVVIKDGVFYMAYSAMGCDEDMKTPWRGQADRDYTSSCIMGATSTDGIHWTPTSGPLAIWEKEKGWNENTTPEGYYGGYQRPSLMYDEGKWRLWFDYNNGSKQVVIGYSENTGDFNDVSSWKRLYYNKNSMGMGVDFDVVKIGSIYYAYSDASYTWYNMKWEVIVPDIGDKYSKWNYRQIMEHQSYDGVNWRVTGMFMPDDTYAANHVPQVLLDHKNNRVCLFYTTQPGTRKSTTYDWRWDNIRVMYRDLELFKTAPVKATPGKATPTPFVTDEPTKQATKQPTAAADGNGQGTIPVYQIILLIALTLCILAVIAITLLILNKIKKITQPPQEGERK